MPSAQKLVERARLDLISLSPFYGVLAMNLRLEQVDDGNVIDTMAVDGVTMYFHPPFVKKLTGLHLMGVVAHETMHCALHHMTRRGDRDPKLWNYAGDFVINLLLRQDGFELPEPHLYDPKYRNWTTEEVYNDLLVNPPPQPKGGQKPGQQGAGQGKPGSGQGNDPYGTGGVIDAPGEAAQQDDLSTQWDITVQQAVAVARASKAGTFPAGAERLYKERQKSKVHWSDILRNFVDSMNRKDFTWVHPNRRFIGSGSYMPGYRADGFGHLVMIADTSGSISDGMLGDFAAEIRSVLDEGLVDKITVVYADAGFSRVEEFTASDEFVFRPRGGGGTDFRASFQYVDEHLNDVTAIIYFTDMETMSWGEQPPCPVLWAYHGASTQVDAWQKAVPFGSVVHITP